MSHVNLSSSTGSITNELCLGLVLSLLVPAATLPHLMIQELEAKDVCRHLMVDLEESSSILSGSKAYCSNVSPREWPGFGSC